MRQFILFVALLAMIGMAGATYTAITPTTPDELNDYGRMPNSWATLAGNASINNFAMDGGYDYLLLVNVTSWVATLGNGRYVSVMAGDNPPAFRSGIGNLTVTPTAKGTMWIGPLESARFKNSTGYCEISSYNLTGTVTLLKIPSL